MPGRTQVIEKIAQFGDEQNLIGIVTHPAVHAGPASDLAFVLLNAGVIHRVGPGRLNVKLARRLAAEGHTSLRFDLSGIGDSLAAQSTLSWEAQAVEDIRAAIDYMQSISALRRFVLVGLCSGADNGFASAVADQRVIGLFMLDPNTYPTWRTRPRFLRIGLGKPGWLLGSLRTHIRRMVNGLWKVGEEKTGQPKSADQNGRERYVRPKPPLAEFAAGLTAVLDRGGAVMAVYSGSAIREFSHPRQLDEALRPFGLEGRIGCRLWGQVNHTFTELSAQTQLADTIVAWARELAAQSGVTES
jgi:hypothetical protein